MVHPEQVSIELKDQTLLPRMPLPLRCIAGLFVSRSVEEQDLLIRKPLEEDALEGTGPDNGPTPKTLCRLGRWKDDGKLTRPTNLHSTFANRSGKLYLSRPLHFAGR